MHLLWVFFWYISWYDIWMVDGSDNGNDIRDQFVNVRYSHWYCHVWIWCISMSVLIWVQEHRKHLIAHGGGSDNWIQLVYFETGWWNLPQHEIIQQSSIKIYSEPLEFHQLSGAHVPCDPFCRNKSTQKFLIESRCMPACVCFIFSSQLKNVFV